MKRAAWAASGVAVCLTAIAGGVVLWPGSSPRIPLPADDASPSEVVTTMVAAWSAHDDATVTALDDPRWQANTAPYAHVELIHVTPQGADPTAGQLGGVRTGEDVQWVTANRVAASSAATGGSTRSSARKVIAAG